MTAIQNDPSAPHVPKVIHYSREACGGGKVTARVFLSHAQDDKPRVERLYKRLKAVGISPWLHSEEVKPGQDWDFEISQVIPTSAAVVVILSSRSVTKKGSFRKKQGYFQKEIECALAVAKTKPRGTRFIMPVRLDDCGLPENLRQLHWVDLFVRNGFENLHQSLQQRIVSITDSSSQVATAAPKKSTGQTRTLIGHQERVYAAPFSPRGAYLASASYDHRVKLWHVAEGCDLLTFEGHTDMVFWVAFSHSGLLLASASRDRTARIWDIESGRAATTLRGHKHWVHSVAFAPNDRWLATGSDDATVRLWSVQTGRTRLVLRGHYAAVMSVAFSPVGKNLASGGADSAIKLWKADSGRNVRTLLGHSDSVTCVVFSPDGRQLASASHDQTARLWDVKTGTTLKRFKAKSQVNSVAFSPDGQFLAGACFDGTVRIWDVTTGKSIRVLKGHVQRVFSATFSPNGHLLASAGEDRTIRLWKWRPSPKALARSK
jgi:WD40 repeat protein